MGAAEGIPEMGIKGAVAIGGVLGIAPMVISGPLAEKSKPNMIATLF
jgi:hypothetical protein